jgi:DNA-directed RNA polymerase I and III subunit RPAC2
MVGEDHTLGNSFRYMLAKNADVDFVGYSIPHPSEMKLNMRVQTKPNSGIAVTDVLVQSAQTLADVCDHVLATFDEAERVYEQQHPPQAPAASSGASVVAATGASAMEE